MKISVQLGFEILGYPGTGRRVEDEGDLAKTSGVELFHGAFMGDGILVLHGTDLSPRFGWVTLIDWCIKIAAVRSALAVESRYVVNFSESEDWLQFERQAGEIHVSCSYNAELAHATHEDFDAEIERFLLGQLKWIEREYPQVMKNPAMADIRARIACGDGS
ncbi:hypothetical protein [Streptomyces sp. NPDC051000]|uniref:hypothetical protein n=1 Tax=Streptomyces sp. NPDC051000 TaxID=3155520 RepID=UPI0033CE979A